MAFMPYDEDNAALVAKEVPGGNAEPMTISALSAALKRTVEDRFGYVRVRGELSRVTFPASGHLYTALKDEKAVIDAVMWKGVVARLPFRPEVGLEVVVSGKLTTFPGQSKYQIVIESMEIAGEGALLALLAKTKARLEAEGLFAPARKRPLPYLPQTIGVITSPSGAVIRDILHRLSDRFPSHVLVWPVLVQGKGAAEQVAAALRGFSMMPQGRPDVVIVARGGGSVEDLWAFNEEVVVRAIADCNIPVISAVGHETDTTLADFAADLRAPTPSAAAELVVPVRADLRNQVAELALRQGRAVTRPLTLGRERLAARADRLPAPTALLQPHAQRLDDAAERLRRALAGLAQNGQMRLHGAAARLSLPILQARFSHAQQRLATLKPTPQRLHQRLGQDQARLDGLGRMLVSLNPDRVLERGYVRVTGANGDTLVSKDKAEKEPALRLHFKDGALTVYPAGAAPRPVSLRKSPPQSQDDLFG